MSNLICAVLMGIIMYAAVSRLLDHRRQGTKGYLYILTLVYCLLEYLMWISSCLPLEDNLKHPYYWFDVLLSISFLLFIPAVKKEGRTAE